MSKRLLTQSFSRMTKFHSFKNSLLKKSHNHNYFISQYRFASSSSSASTIQPLVKDIDSKLLTIEKTKNPKPKLPNDKLLFGKTFTDHILVIDWDNTNGWHQPQIIPYQPFSIDPSASVFHYALEAFEGLKAYKDNNNQIRLFRPHKNMERLLKSCESLFFPLFNPKEFYQCLTSLIQLDSDWIPKQNGYSLYIRPTIISTTPFIGVSPATQIKLYVILSPVGPYYSTGFKAIKLLATNKYVRAWPKGSGDKKIGANYGPVIRAQMEAMKMGYSQILWLFEKNNLDYLTEVGTMNQFFFWINEQGEKELITPPLDGTILPGVTRDSILHICKEWNEFKVSEKSIHMKQIIKAIEEKRILEAFGAGTAAIVSPIKSIGYNGKDYSIPLNPNDSKSESGPLANRLFQYIMDIQYGRVPNHPWSVII